MSILSTILRSTINRSHSGPQTAGGAFIKALLRSLGTVTGKLIGSLLTGRRR